MDHRSSLPHWGGEAGRGGERTDFATKKAADARAPEAAPTSPNLSAPKGREEKLLLRLSTFIETDAILT